MVAKNLNKILIAQEFTAEYLCNVCPHGVVAAVVYRIAGLNSEVILDAAFAENLSDLVSVGGIRCLSIADNKEVDSSAKPCGFKRF